MFSRVGVSLPKGGATEHTATAFTHGSTPKLIVFGGWNGAYHTNELAVLSTDAIGANVGSDGWGWEPNTVTGRGPSPRSGHSATPLDEDGKGILFFGGEYSTVSRKYYASTDVLDTTTLTWRPLEAIGVEPRPRSQHAAAHVGGGRVLVFGGCSSYGGSMYLNDLHELDTARCEWKAWEPAATGAFAPCARMGATLTHAAEAGGAVLFGGEDGADSFNDVALFETASRMWRPLQLSGMAPLPRAGHSATLVSPSRVYVFGGRTRTRADAAARERARGAEYRYLHDLTILDLATMSFSQPALSTRVCPEPRAFHSATSLVGADGVPYVLLLGGRGEGRVPFASAFVLDVALVAGVQDYANGYAILASQLQAARIDVARTADSRDAAEQAVAEALEDAAAAVRDAGDAGDEVQAFKKQLIVAENKLHDERLVAEQLMGSLRDAQAMLAEQRAALTHAVDTASRLGTDRAADARAAQKAADDAAEEHRAAASKAAAEHAETQAELVRVRDQLARALAHEESRDEADEALAARVAAKARAFVAAAAELRAQLDASQQELKESQDSLIALRASTSAAADAQAVAHARELEAADARAAASQARSDATASAAQAQALAAADAARAAEVAATTLEAQLSHSVAIEQAAQLRLRETQAARAAEAAELRQALEMTATEADEARAALRSARAEGSETLGQITRELDAAHVRIQSLDETRASLQATWTREREALVARIEQLGQDETALGLELETRDASIARLGNDVTAQERLIAAVRAERDALDAAYKNERTTFRVALGALARESSQFEDVLALAHRSNTSLARARAEAEARATQMDSTMRSRLEDVTRALTAEARITEDLLVAGLDQTTAGRLTMRNFESDVSAVMPVSPSMGRRG